MDLLKFWSFFSLFIREFGFAITVGIKLCVNFRLENTGILNSVSEQMVAQLTPGSVLSFKNVNMDKT